VASYRPVQSASSRQPKTKPQPFLLRSEFDLALVDPTSITLQKRAYRSVAPLNLRVAGDGYYPTYAAGADIVADWDRAAALSALVHALRRALVAVGVVTGSA
jgi:hypothetical protein